MILALAGGVGGARLADGLAAVLPPGELTVVVNTGDDFEHLGLHVSPDLDTVMYTLAGLNDEVQGWGLAGETWNFLAAVERLGGETWFRLGDRDLATHVERTRRLKAETLSAITADFCTRLGIAQRIVPMSDDPVRTMVDSDEGRLAFQDYFVRRRCAPVVSGLHFEGAAMARPSPGFAGALAAPDLSAIIICPSNPLLSILPILELPGMRALLAARRVPLIAVSPIVGGRAIKGPAAKIMAELDLAVSPAGIADFYGPLLDGLVIDAVDKDDAPTITGPSTFVTDTIMRDGDTRRRLAEEVLLFADRLRR